MAFRPLLALPLLGLALLSACDEPEQLRALDLAELPERFACADLTLVAAAFDGSEALLIGIDDGLAAAARASAVPVEAEYELPDPRLTVRWVAGTNVYQGNCDRDSGGSWRLEQRHHAITGQITVRISPTEAGALALGTTLEGLVLTPIGSDDQTASYELAPTQLETLILEP